MLLLLQLDCNGWIRGRGPDSERVLLARILLTVSVEDFGSLACQRRFLQRVYLACRRVASLVALGDRVSLQQGRVFAFALALLHQLLLSHVLDLLARSLVRSRDAWEQQVCERPVLLRRKHLLLRPCQLRWLGLLVLVISN